jgi:hypothetical protein
MLSRLKGRVQRRIIPVTAGLWVLAVQVAGTVATAGADNLTGFEWDVITSPQYADNPLNARLIGRGADNEIFPDAIPQVSLSALRLDPGEFSTFGEMSTSLAAGFWFQDGTIGYSFTPSSNLMLTHVRVYSGVRATIWTDDGTLLGSQSLESIDPGIKPVIWAKPVMLRSGVRYRIAVYTANRGAITSMNRSGAFPHGVIHSNYTSDAGDSFPDTPIGGQWWFVDLGYRVLTPASASVSPTLIGPMPGGEWAGTIGIAGEGADMVLLADDGQGHVGITNPFNVWGRKGLILKPAAGLNYLQFLGEPRPAAQSVSVFNSTDETITWSVTDVPDWLQITPASGTLAAETQATLIVSLTQAADVLAVGQHASSVAFTSTAEPGMTVPFTVIHRVTQARSLNVSQVPAAPFAGVVGGPFAPPSQSFVVTNVGLHTFTWSVDTDVNWLTLAPTGGDLLPGSSATVVATLNELANELPYPLVIPAGTHCALLAFTNHSALGDAVSLPLCLTLLRPGRLTASPASIGIRGIVGGSFEATSFQAAVRNLGDLPLNWRIVQRPSLFDVNPRQGSLGPQASTLVSAALNPLLFLLPPGTYAGSFIVMSDDGQEATVGTSVEIRLPAPTMITEPPETYGTSNTVSWTDSYGADEYKVLVFQEPNFVGAFAESPWTSGLAHTFSGLTTGRRYHYLVRSRIQTTGSVRAWTQSGAAELSSGSMTGVTVAADGLVLDGTGTGTLISEPISPDSWRRWGRIHYVANHAAGMTTLTVDVLDEAGNLIAHDVVSGTDLGPVTSVVPLRLRATFSTTVAGQTPRLSGWGVSWNDDTPALVESDWSAPTSSMQIPIVPPRVDGASGDVIVPIGGIALFSVTATGTQPLAYQWMFNGAPLEGATNAAFSIADVRGYHGGNYSVRVSNAFGETNSPGAVLAVVGGGSFVSRFLPGAYVGGNSFTVTLLALPRQATLQYVVEESPPPGWTIGSVSHGGVFDSQNGKLHFGPFPDDLRRDLTYVLTPPSGETATGRFAGLAFADGVSTVVAGGGEVSPPPFHPADRSPADNWLTSEELTAYASAWKQDDPWPLPPNTIPVSFLTKAATLHQQGGQYAFDFVEHSAPQYWISASTPPHGLSHQQLTNGAVAHRIFPPRFATNVPMRVHLMVKQPHPGLSWAVEETPPFGALVSNPSEGGVYTVSTGTVRWGPFHDNELHAFSYDLTFSPAVGQLAPMTGVISVDGWEWPVRGTVFANLAPLPSQPEISSLVQLTGREIGFSAAIRPGRAHVIEASQDLVTWIPIHTNATSGGALFFLDQAAGNYAGRFYRVVER